MTHDNATPWKLSFDLNLTDANGIRISLAEEKTRKRIIDAVNSYDELLSALKRLMLTEGSGSHNETLCYCDDYRKPEICQFCQATQAIAKASIK